MRTSRSGSSDDKGRGESAVNVPYFILALLCLISVVSRLYLMLR
jgi:hypothetical protein